MGVHDATAGFAFSSGRGLGRQACDLKDRLENASQICTSCKVT